MAESGIKYVLLNSEFICIEHLRHILVRLAKGIEIGCTDYKADALTTRPVDW